MMSTAKKFLLRVYLSSDVAVKVTLSERPESVEELINILKEKVKQRLDFEFTLQYEDPDFDGQLSCLVDINELPEKGTLRVVRTESDTSSCASSDTDILPHVPVSHRLKTWPDVFPVPTFSYEVEHVLAEGNDLFESSGETVKLNRAQKHNILETMAAAMHSYKSYPSDRDVGVAAEALVRTHPCLKELGSVSGWYGWKVSLKFKMGNYRTKLARSGCLEVSINTGKRSRNNPDRDSPHTNIKRARRAEVNYLPDFPRGENQASLEGMRLQITQEVAKSDKDKILIEKLMQTTFALRRQEIVQESPLVKDILERWPALQMEAQVCAEFHRIAHINLRNQFYSELDRHTPRLLAVYRQKAGRTGKASEALRNILKLYDQQVQDIDIKRTTALWALSAYLCEDDPDFYKTWNTEETDEPDITDTPVALVMMVTESTLEMVPFTPDSFSIAVEDNMMLMSISRFSDAFALVFGLMYVLHLDYPSKLTNTFTFIEKVVMGLDDGKPLKPRLLSLKHDLLQ